MDHARINVNSSGISCGVKELSRMSDEAIENLFAIANAFYHPSRGNPPAFCIWSNLDDTKINGGEGTNGHRLQKAVVDLGFGIVTKTAPALNPNTGNPIAVWTWLIDHEKFKNWYKVQRILKLSTR